jgi:Tfp pilus assembly protein PilN
MSAPKQQLINLLPQEEFAASTLGRVLKWILSTFRIIVILTEGVVMAGFLSRFYLDARIADLNEEIKVKQATIASYSQLEKDFRSAQSKTQIVSNLFREKDRVVNNLNEISSLAPSEVVFSTYSVLGKQATLKAITPTENLISQLVTNLRASKKFGSVALNQISSNEGGAGLIFALKIDLKDKENK